MHQTALFLHRTIPHATVQTEVKIQPIFFQTMWQ
jgi:hypothetical protein